MAVPTESETNHQQTLRQPERSSTEIVHALFGPSVGPCWGDFSCSFNRQHGRLYASSMAILFYSNLFGFERRLSMRFTDVVGITLHRTTSIKIIMVDEEEFVFRSLSDRVYVLKLLEDLRRLTLPPILTPPRRTYSQQLLPHEEEQVPEQELVSGADQESVTEEVADRDLGLNAVENQPCDDILTNQDTYSVDLSPPEELVFPPRSRNQSYASELESTADINNLSFSSPPEEGPILRRKPLASIDASDVSSSPSENVAESWSQLKASNEPTFKNRFVEELRVNCTLHQFYEAFLQDDAPHSITHFQENEIGDKDVKATAWARDTNTLEDAMTRTITFRHPVSSALLVGKSHTKTRREQRLRRFGDIGMCLSSSAFVQGVPGADSFQVDDRWLIESRENSCTLTIEQETRFVKKTMLRKMIEKSINTELKDWHKGFENLIQKVFPQGSAPIMTRQPTEHMDESQDKVHHTDPWVLPPTPWLVLFVLLLLILWTQLVIMWMHLREIRILRTQLQEFMLSHGHDTIKKYSYEQL